MTPDVDSVLGTALDPADLALVCGSVLVVVAVAVLVVDGLGRRRGWSAEETATLTWSSAVAAASVVSLLLIQPWQPPTRRFATELEGVGTLTGGGIFTLVWMPPVMALLWSVVHVLRSGAGHRAPLLGVPPLLAVPTLWLVAAPLQVTVLTVGVLGALTWAGLVVYLVGQALVATGRSWVGDVAVWTGVALVAADAWPGYVGLVSPVVVAALVLWQRGRPAPVS